MIVDGIHGTPSDSTGLPSLFAGTDIAFQFLLVVNGTNPISGIKGLRRYVSERIGRKNSPGEQKAAEVSIKALSKPKTRYAERDDAVSSSDWLAVALKEHCPQTASTSASSSVCLRKMTWIWNIDRETHGWIGRFRMNGRQAGGSRATTGFILVSGEKVRAPGAKKRDRKPKAVVVES